MAVAEESALLAPRRRLMMQEFIFIFDNPMCHG
ncbi:MAG: hypothetical protein ACD_75C00288G0002 [uncultured bacterium]|nr:MAG: hypothetical protein ACD_75C00288G0002 [uncultured bacterium]